ncbi:MAG: ABC transporter ATP-binding protein, partial [Terriglobales bacterium]
MSDKLEFWRGWRERLSALRNVPAVLRFVWDAGRVVVIFGLLSRVVAATLPLALFWVSKLIIDNIYRILTTHQSAGPRLWWLVALEFGIAVLIGVLGRAIDYLDTVLAGKYMHHISVRVMEQAASLDLLAYEDPVFYDRLERARVQATDRLYMIQAIGRLVQQVITTITLSISIMLFSPWLLLLLVVGVIPAFVGETHFAFLGYAKNFGQTPIRRQLDYLRQAGATKEAAKELKLFNLAHFFTDRFAKLSDIIYEQDVELARKRLGIGSI